MQNSSIIAFMMCALCPVSSKHSVTKKQYMYSNY